MIIHLSKGGIHEVEISSGQFVFMKKVAIQEYIPLNSNVNDGEVTAIKLVDDV